MATQSTSFRRRILFAFVLSAAALAPLTAFAQTRFIEPTSDELAMTSLPGYPGVAAVVLRREETDYDDKGTSTVYQRVKILSEDGKKYANVELPFVTTLDDSDYLGNEKSVEDIRGRTIHPDGTIIPFTGKPYLKIIEKSKEYKYQAKVFTLPDVTAGSIIEYSYVTRFNNIEAPLWIVQGDLYVKSAHYLWYPRTAPLFDQDGNPIRTIVPFPVLPKGTALAHHNLAGTGGTNGLPTDSYELTIGDVPPVVDEDYMPPLSNFGYRVYFSHISAVNGVEFWKNSGRSWSKRVSSFTTPNSDLKDATQKIIAGAATQDQKLRAIYAAVMKFENTDFTREHEVREDEAAGLGRLTTANDVFKRERGNSTQLTELFIAMARAAGMQADAMLVPDRSQELFIPQWLNMHQFHNMIAIVNVDGKEQYFDPGSRYCSYDHLAWQHEFTKGLRQKGSESAFDETPGDTNRDNAIFRVANLNMDATGRVTGTIDMTYLGAEALRWRQAALRGDDESLKHDLRASLEDLIPHSLEITDAAVSNLDDYENPLKVSFAVEGTVGSWTGKRLVLPADLFLENQKAIFSHEKRDVAVDFQYPRQTRDALRINFPSSFSTEATPAAAKYNLGRFFAYAMNSTPDANGITTRRDYASEAIYVLPEEYPQLRTFYSQFETNDQQSIVLKSAAAPTTTASATPGSGK